MNATPEQQAKIDALHVRLEHEIQHLPVPMSIRAWLTELQPFQQDDFSPPQQVPRWRAFFWLMACNGGPQVRGWGCIGFSGGAFQRGLDQGHALLLQAFHHIVIGMDIASGCDLYQFIGPLHGVYYREMEAIAREPEAALIEKATPP